MTQLELQQKCLNDANVSIVTCGDCGDVLLIDFTSDLEDIECLSCGFTGEIADFPDLCY